MGLVKNRAFRLREERASRIPRSDVQLTNDSGHPRLGVLTVYTLVRSQRHQDVQYKGLVEIDEVEYNGGPNIVGSVYAYYCDCPDWKDGNFCKHLLAALMYTRKEWPSE